ncbi:aminodeoxychorismate lyase [Pseudoalteromonas umbrosa]|uniref:aminodeoxychorismate lyase n=1 Tax=Pseudoalteromonas umbrosa TaxID=3048489 RepID=UPI0024C40505|nr:aminodeoxychorismate lyase [Pseudoalteromonas sp. B95]MDK1289945.1 aminodeoxychorismate lyase [Pseudoalteromonas sp. B95]
MEISHRDRGLSYGDGFFTTIKVENEALQLWPYHLQRLQQCQQALHFPELDEQALLEACQNAIKGCHLGVLKLLITRGEGGRGYALPEHIDLTVIVSKSEFPSHYAQWQAQGVSLSVSNVKLGHQPLLAGLKTLNRLEQVLIKEDALGLSGDDVVVLDLQDNVIECSASNIIIVKNGQLITPNLALCGIRGVYLSLLSDHHDIAVEAISMTDLMNADAVFMCNSLMGLVPVKSIDKKTFNLQTALELKTKIEISL